MELGLKPGKEGAGGEVARLEEAWLGLDGAGCCRKGTRACDTRK